MSKQSTSFNNYPLSKCTTFKQSGAVAKFSKFNTLDDLVAFLKLKEDYFIVGKGSNSIINPESSIKHVIQLSGDMFKPECNSTQVTFSAGTSVNDYLKFCIKHGCGGLEFSAGVPATIGGMVTMNFGCWGTEVSDILESVLILDDQLNKTVLTNKDLHFDYRKSIFQEKKWIILKATFNYKRQDPDVIKKTVHTYIKDRLAKQPIRSKTFGSIFANPKNHFAAKLIEEAGLKGFEMGGVKLSSQHANFMENLGLATYEDVKNMVSFVQKKIVEKFQIKLEPEVKFYE
tara:strand:- start:2146 stop:3006 length:861 start_codon:yes stop_codon:yes gene_type:complete